MSIDLPNYRILQQLGVGANSKLLLARNVQTGARYTVKVVKVKDPEDMRFVDQLREEHDVGSAMDHPFLRKTFELRFHRRRLRIISGILFMEYVEGLPLNDPGFTWSLTGLLRVFRMAAEGLHAMHRAGFVHADLKPGNILITPDKRIKIIDYGQACPMRTSKPGIQGTIDYIAPEQVNRGTLDARTDVFGLGATLYKVLTGHSIPTELNRRVDLHSLSLVGKRVDEVNNTDDIELAGPIERLISACCQEDASKRPSDMRVLMDRLEMVRKTLKRREAASKHLGDSAAEPIVAEAAADDLARS